MSRRHPPSRPRPGQPHDPARDRSPSSSPKRFPANPAPLSDDGLEASKKSDAESAAGAGGDSNPRPPGPVEDGNPGSGGDPAVESGRPEHDPERPKQELPQRPM